MSYAAVPLAGDADTFVKERVFRLCRVRIDDS